MSSEPSHLSSTWILHVHVRCLGSLFAAAARRYTYPCSRNHDKQTPRPSAAHSASWPRSNSRNQPNHHLQQDDAVAGTPWRRCDRQPDETRRLETAQYHTNDTRRDETRRDRRACRTLHVVTTYVVYYQYPTLPTYLQHPLPAAATGLAARFYLPSTRCTAWRVNHGGVRMVAASRTDGLVVAECQSGRLGQPVRVWGH